MEKYIFQAKDTGLSFDAKLGYLEEITYKGKVISQHSKFWSIQTNSGELGICDMADFHIDESRNAVNLCWSCDAAKVIVTLKRGDADKIYMNIRTEVAGDAIRRVKFPIFEGLKFEGDNYLLMPWQNGHLIKNPVDTLLCKNAEVPFWMGDGEGAFISNYPAGMCFQFSAFYKPGDLGLYFATEDGDAYTKTFAYEYNKDLHAMDYSLTNYPENMGKAKSYCMPHEFALKIFEGDWQDAAKLYRTWAIEQKWWKKKLSERKLPEKIINADLWRINHMNYELGTRTQEYMDTAKVLRDTVGCNLAQHWYGWNMGMHGLNYPEYISDERKAEGWPAELKKWNEKFDAEGIVKIPFVNARLWEKKLKSWEGAIPAAVKDEKGEFPNEPWGEDVGFELKPLCPSTALWQNKIVDMCKEYIRDGGFDGVYLDQIGSFNATLCFDESHPHPLGGGSWWNDAHHAMIQGARDIVGEGGIITTEGCCETYIGEFDMFLILDTCFQHTGWNYLTEGGDTVSVPLFSMVYGDYALSYGSICRFVDRNDRFEYNFIRNLLWGIIPCVEGVDAEDLARGDAGEKLEILKRAVKFFKEHKDIFLYGRMCEIPEYECETFPLDWEIEDIGTYVEDTPVICASTWETKDGERYMFAYNFTNDEHKMACNWRTYRVPGKSFYVFKI